MLRDDIKDKVIELMHQHFPWLNDDEDTPIGVSNRIKIECETFNELGINMSDIREFVEDVLLVEFELNDIDLAEVVKWRAIKNIVDFLENHLAPALGDMP